MKETLRQRLDSFSDRFEELAMLLSDPEVINNQQRFRDYSREYSELEELVAAWKRYLEVENSIAEAEQLSRDSDPEMRELAEMEILDGREQLEALDVELKRLLIPKDPDDGRGVFLEVRAGTGGDEAAIFAGDLFRMYSRYAEKRGEPRRTRSGFQLPDFGRDDRPRRDRLRHHRARSAGAVRER